MSAIVIRKGMFTTVQDGGRTGHAAEGFSVCGASDRRTFTAANLIVGNRPDEATLEFTVDGPTLRFEEDAVVSVCAPDSDPDINGNRVPVWTPLRVQAGDVVCAGRMKYGLRGYLAVKGGIRVPRILGSRATDLRCGIGGLEGRALRNGDVLPVIPCGGREYKRVFRRWRILNRRAPMTNEYRTEPVARLLPGPEADRFSREAVGILTSCTYRVSVDSNRMGLRLEGPAVVQGLRTDIPSGGLQEGAIQITSGGTPIVMLADCQTTGGYARIASVIPTDLPALAQLRPGEKLSFRMTDRGAALRAYRFWRMKIGFWERGIGKYADGRSEC